MGVVVLQLTGTVAHARPLYKSIVGPKDLFAERNSSRIKSAYDIDHESRLNQIFVYVSRLIPKPLSRACKIGESRITNN